MDIKKLSFIIFLFLIFCVNNIVHSEILTIYSDEGTPQGTNIYNWGGDPVFDSNNQELYFVPEGTRCFKTTYGGTYAGWGVFYVSTQNFSNFSGGELRFWINTTTGQVKVEIEQGNGIKGTKWITDFGWTESDLNQWKHIRAPLNSFGVDLSSITGPFIITADTGLGGTATFYVDLVRWVTSDVLSPYFNIKIKDIETHLEKSSFTFNVNLQQVSSWTVANEYIELEFDPDNTSWGIQIYTDNKASSANPIYTGTGNPCGLVDTTTTTKVLPMGWTIESSTKTKEQLGKGTPESWVSGGFMWKWMKDRNTEGFQNGDYYITVWDNRGILWGGSSTDRDWKNSPNYIYLSADFSTALGGRTYKTNQLKIEFYYK